MPRDDLPDRPGWYWIRFAGERPAWWDTERWVFLVAEVDEPLDPEDVEAVLGPVLGPEAANRLDELDETVRFLEGLQTQLQMTRSRISPGATREEDGTISTPVLEIRRLLGMEERAEELVDALRDDAEGGDER